MIPTTETTPETTAKVHVLIAAAGRGVRFGTADNKVFADLAGRPVIAHTVDRFLASGIPDTVTVIGRSDELDRLRTACGSENAARVFFCEGGATRQASVERGLGTLEAAEHDIVLVHDGARPLVSTEVIRRCVDAISVDGMALAAVPVTETVKLAHGDQSVAETRERDGLWLAQTPQGAQYGLLKEAFGLASREGFVGTDEASLLERLPSGRKPKLVLGARENIKITTQEDLEFANQWLMPTRMNRYEMRVGMGYDIHRLVPDRRLVLGGIEIPSNGIGLLGHSDADVLLHAVCDALLGACGLPDIGHLFPNTDPAYAGADSCDLLRSVYQRLQADGWAVGNVDCCVIAERPKISPYSSKMCEKIAGILQVEDGKISIKATTNEGLGSLGAGEGIACHATATIYRQ